MGEIETESTEFKLKKKVSATRKPRRDQIADLTTAAIQISSVTTSSRTKENSYDIETNKKVNFFHIIFQLLI